MKNQYVKFGLDLAMGIVLAMLFNTSILGGQAFHEIAGIVLGAAILCHLLFNLPWIKNSGRILRQKGGVKAKVCWWLDLVIFLDLMFMVVSGLAISKVVLTASFSNAVLNKATHVGSSYLGLLLAGVHVGLHWDWVMGIFRRIFKLNKPSKARGIIAKALAAAVFAFGCFSIYTTSYFNNVARLFNGGQGQGGGMEEHGGQMPSAPTDGQTPSAPTDGQAPSTSGQGQMPSAPSNGQAPNASGEGRGERGDGQGRMNGGNGTSGIGSTASYLAVIGAFATGEYYIEHLLTRKKKTDGTSAKTADGGQADDDGAKPIPGSDANPVPDDCAEPAADDGAKPAAAEEVKPTSDEDSSPAADAAGQDAEKDAESKPAPTAAEQPPVDPETK